MTTMGQNAEREAGSLQRRALLAGVILIAAAMADGFRAPQQFFRSYLLAFVFWIGFPLGSAAFLMMHYLTGGNWGIPLRRPLHTGFAVLPVFALLLIPLFFGLHLLFPWAQRAGPEDPLIQQKSFYLNIPFFVGRQILYFAVWGWLAFRFGRWFRELSGEGGSRALARLENLSAPGLIGYVLTATFFAIDWVMSLDVHWFSTIFGLIFVAAQAQMGLCFSVLAAYLTEASNPGRALKDAGQAFNDIGNLQLTFVMLWAYLGFSQFLIIWAGNLVGDISWYLARTVAGWGAVALLLIIFYFAVPFGILLRRGFKRSISNLAKISAWLIFANFVYVFWIVAPSFLPQPRFYLLDFLLVAGMGCIALSCFARGLKKAPALT